MLGFSRKKGTKLKEEEKAENVIKERTEKNKKN